MTPAPEGYLDLYKLAVEMADRVSARRAIASSFFLTAQSALVALAGVAAADQWAFALPGLLLAAAWWVLLRSYRLLNSAKFDVIQNMESQLPAAPYRDEWRILKSAQPQTLRDRYAELGLVEQVVPVVFGAIFLVILVTNLT